MKNMSQGAPISAPFGAGEARGAARQPVAGNGQGELKLADQLERLACQYMDQGERKEAASLYERAKSVKEMVLGADHPQVLDYARKLAGIYELLSEYEKAELLHKQVIASSERSAAPGKKPELAVALSELAIFYQSQGKDAEAEVTFRRALALQEGTNEPDSPTVVDLLDRLATLAVTRDLKQTRRSGGSHSTVSLFEALYELGVFFHGQKEFGRAARLYRAALKQLATNEEPAATFEEIDGEEFSGLGSALPRLPEIAQSLQTLGKAHLKNCRLIEAEMLTKRSLAVRVCASGRMHPAVAESLTQLGEICFLGGRRKEAIAHLRLAIAIKEELLGPLNADLAPTLSDLSKVCLADGNLVDSERLVRRALAILQENGSMGEPVAAVVLNNLSEMCLLKGRNAVAQSLAEQALAILEAPAAAGYAADRIKKPAANIFPSKQEQRPVATEAVSNELDIYESNILKLVAAGAGNVEIAERLESLPCELQTKLSGIMQKLAGSSREEARQILRASVAC